MANTHEFTDELLLALLERGDSLAQIAQTILPFEEKNPGAGLEVGGVIYYNNNLTPGNLIAKRNRVNELHHAVVLEKNRTKQILQARTRDKERVVREAEERRAIAFDEHHNVIRLCSFVEAGLKLVDAKRAPSKEKILRIRDEGKDENDILSESEGLSLPPRNSSPIKNENNRFEKASYSQAEERPMLSDRWEASKERKLESMTPVPQRPVKRQRHGEVKSEFNGLPPADYYGLFTNTEPLPQTMFRSSYSGATASEHYQQYHRYPGASFSRFEGSVIPDYVPNLKFESDQIPPYHGLAPQEAGGFIYVPPLNTFPGNPAYATNPFNFDRQPTVYHNGLPDPNFLAAYTRENFSPLLDLPTQHSPSPDNLPHEELRSPRQLPKPEQRTPPIFSQFPQSTVDDNPNTQHQSDTNTEVTEDENRPGTKTKLEA